MKGFDTSVKQLLLYYHWPGNVRELKHVMEHAMIMTDDSTIKMEHLPYSFSRVHRVLNITSLRETLRETEERLIEQALLQTDGNMMQAARLLDIPRQTLQYKLQKNIDRLPNNRAKQIESLSKKGISWAIQEIPF
ncbi:hypothetical protein GCM10020331_064040 [Ectobacillus funiculus]